jgi:hypothetical protein
VCRSNPELRCSPSVQSHLVTEVRVGSLGAVRLADSPPDRYRREGQQIARHQSSIRRGWHLFS